MLSPRVRSPVIGTASCRRHTNKVIQTSGPDLRAPTLAMCVCVQPGMTTMMFETCDHRCPHIRGQDQYSLPIITAGNALGKEDKFGFRAGCPCGSPLPSCPYGSGLGKDRGIARLQIGCVPARVGLEFLFGSYQVSNMHVRNRSSFSIISGSLCAIRNLPDSVTLHLLITIYTP